MFYDLEGTPIQHLGRRRRHYWSFLTLTGIGQLFEATTAQGRVATVVSILTATVMLLFSTGVSVAQTGRNRRWAEAPSPSTAGVDGENRTRTAHVRAGLAPPTTHRFER